MDTQTTTEHFVWDQLYFNMASSLKKKNHIIKEPYTVTAAG